MDEQVVSFSQLINKTFSNIKCEDVEKADEVLNIWKKVLLSIKGVANGIHPENPYEGQNLYEHSRIVDFKKGVLLVEADHPGWIQLLQLHKQYIINGLNKETNKIHIETMAFRLTGKKGEIYDTEKQEFSVEKIRSFIQTRADKEENMITQKIKEKDAYIPEKQDLPQELNSLFDDLKKSVLTNSKK